MHVNTDSQKLKADQKFFFWGGGGVDMVKNRCGQSADGTLQLTLSEERADGNFFCMLIKIPKNQKLVKSSLGGHGQK